MSAELHSYGLLLPRPGYCCAFQVAIKPSGDVALRLTVPDGIGMPEDVSSSYTASEAELSAIRSALGEFQYFELPKSIHLLTGFHPEHREMNIRLGERSHAIQLVIPGSCALGEERLYAEGHDADRALVRRACGVWQAIRAVVKDSRLEID